MDPCTGHQQCWLCSEESVGLLVQSGVPCSNRYARPYHRVLKLAQTVADLARCEGIATVHLADAIQYRQRSVGP